MPAISSKIMIQAIDDGSTIHGSLLVSGSLAQAYTTGGAVVPDWTQQANQPTVYLSLMKNVTQKAQLINYQSVKWYFNGVEIPFNNSTDLNTYSENIPLEAGTFQRYAMGTSPNAVPALKIIKNIASENNTDNDLLGFRATYSENGASIPFELNVNIRIEKINPNGYFGILMPATKVSYNGTNKYVMGGDFGLEDDIGEVVMYPLLYDASGNQVSYHVSPLDTTSAKNYYADYELSPLEVDESADECFVDNLPVYAQASDATAAGLFPALRLTDAEVVDYVIVACKFWKEWDSTQGEAGYSGYMCTAYQEVDDLNDPEMMYVEALHSSSTSQSGESGEGTTSYLRAGDHVDFTFWVGSQTSTLPDQRWTHFYVKFLSTGNEPYMGDLTATGIANPLSDSSSASDYGYRQVYHDITGIEAYHGMFRVNYDELMAMGSKVTGLLAAATEALPDDTYVPA